VGVGSSFEVAPEQLDKKSPAINIAQNRILDG
jgi:hypothetical protein